MNDAEVNGISRGIMLYLMEQCKEPLDSLSVILCLTLLFYERAKAPEVDFTIEEFANQFSKDMIHHWKSRHVTAKGTDTVQ